MSRRTGVGRFRRRGFAAVLGTLALVLAACASTEPEPADDPASVDDLASADDLQSLADALGDGGVACTLEYEGLRDGDSTVSLCVVDATQVTLRIWDDPATVREFVASGMATEATAYGANWTIDARDPALAGRIASIAGGQVAAGTGDGDTPNPTNPTDE